MKKVIIFLIIGFLILGFLFYVVKYEEKSLEKEKGLTGNVVEDINNSDNGGDFVGGIDSSSIDGSSSGEISSSSGGSGSSSDSSIPPSIPDIESHLCGFYFEEYEICGGTCPEGTCVSEGRSCYCKE